MLRALLGEASTEKNCSAKFNQCTKLGSQTLLVAYFNFLQTKMAREAFNKCILKEIGWPSRKHQQIEFNFWKSEFFTGIIWSIRPKSIWYEVSPAKKGLTFSEVTFKTHQINSKGLFVFFFRDKKTQDLPSKPGEIVLCFFLYSQCLVVQGG